MMVLALEGIKVIDIGRYPMTIYCSMILGDLGADVIWVQESSVMDMGSSTRQTPEEVEKASAFNASGRNKRSIVLNLKTQEAREVFYRMARQADVVLEGYRPGAMKRLGVDYETLQKINPRVVYGSVSGFGQSGPYWDLPGHDGTYTSIAGALGVIGDRDGRPVLPSNLLADFVPGILCAVGVLAALQSRERTGQGQYVDISMTDGVAFLLQSAFSQYFNLGIAPQRGKGQTNGEFPYYTTYETADGQYIIIAPIEPKFFSNLCHLLDRPDVIPWRQDTSMWPQLRELLERTFKEKTRDEWFDILSKAEVPVGKVNSLEEAAKDPQLLHREMFIDVKDRRGKNVKQIGIPFKLSRTPGSVRHVGPKRGEHTQDILRELGYSPQERESLRAKGATSF